MSPIDQMLWFIYLLIFFQSDNAKYAQPTKKVSEHWPNFFSNAPPMEARQCVDENNGGAKKVSTRGSLCERNLEGVICKKKKKKVFLKNLKARPLKSVRINDYDHNLMTQFSEGHQVD